MILSFLKPENIGKKFYAAQEYTRGLVEDFPEHERIARNKPKDNKPAGLPDTTDGTTASIIRKTPKRIVQQLPTGHIETVDDDDWIGVFAEFVYTNEILPYANEEYDLIQKSWTVIERGLTFGSAAVYTPFMNHSGRFTTDMSLVYWGDVFVQPGKKSGYACDYLFIRSWWQPEDIEAIIDKEKQLKKAAEDRGEKYEATWDIKALESIKDFKNSKDEEGMQPHEDEQAIDSDAIEIVTGFQRGIGGTFYTFHPSGGEKNPGECKILRKKKNPDPRGKMPVDWFYGDLDGLNPLGRGIVELIGPLQDLIDRNMQTFEYNRLLAMRPPIVKRGSFSKRKIVLSPDAIIDLGTDAQADISPLNVDTTAITSYPELYGLKKSQLLNLVSSPDTSISAEVGNPGFGKTPTALKQQESIVSVDDNYIRKMFEAFFEHWSETAVNLYFAERKGIEEVQLDDKTADELRKLGKEGAFDLRQLSDDNILLVNYDQLNPELKFRVDASTSKMKNDEKQGEILTSLIQGIDGSPTLSALLSSYPEKGLELWNKLIDSVGLEDPEKLRFDVEETMKQMQEAQQMQQEQAMEEQAMLPQGEIDPSQVPEAEVVETPMDAIYQSFVDQGIPEDLAIDAADMAARGATVDEVMQSLQEVMNAGG